MEKAKLEFIVGIFVLIGMVCLGYLSIKLGKLELIAAAICREDSAAAARRWTLARALVTAEPAAVRVERESGRQPLPELTLAPGRSALWDGRFRVSVAPAFAGGPVQVRALDEANVRALRHRGDIAREAPVRVAALVPSFWLADRLIAIPSLGYWTDPHSVGDLEATFLGLVLRDSGKSAATPA